MAGDGHEVYFGSIGFRGRRMPVNTMDQGLPRIGSGQEIERSAQIGLTKIRVSSLDGGLVSVTGAQPWAQVVNSYVQNDGLVTRIPRQILLPYRLVAQATLDAVNHSGTVAANIRGHGGNTSLGASGLRYVYIIKNYVFTDTSLTDPAIVELANAVLTDTATAIEPNAIFNNTAYFAVAYNGATEDVQGFTDVTAVTYTTGWTKLVTLAAGDYLNAMRTMQTLGTGVNIFVGMINGTNQVWFCKTTSATLPQTSATLLPAVVTETKNVPGSASAVTGSGIDLAVVGVDNASASAGGELAVSGGSVSNGVADMAASVTTGKAYFGNGAFSASYPKGQRVTGISIVVAHVEGESTDNLYALSVKVHAGNQTSLSFADGIELGTSGTDTYGGASITGGLDITTSDLDELVVELQYFVLSTGATANLTLSDVDVTVTYTPDGTSIAFPLGGWQTAPSPAFPHRIAMVAPEATEKTTIFKPRSLWYLDFDWDTAGDRPVFTASKPQTNMAYVHHAAPWQGGYVVTGGDVAGPGEYLRHIDGSGNVRNLGMPRTNGGVWLCNSIIPQGSWLKLYMVKSDYTDFQIWFYSNGKFYPDTLKMSVGPAAIASQPVPFAESASNLQQQQDYNFYPVSTTHLAVVRQFVPRDLDTSPLLINTSEVKSMAYTSNTTEDAFLKLIQPEMDFGPEEALKTIVQGFSQSRLISAAAGAYGSVQSELSIDGGSTYNSTLTKEFTAFNTEYAVTGSGVAYDTIQHRLGLKHEAATAKTPNGANVLWTGVHQWSPETFIDVEVDVESLKPDVWAKIAEIEALMVTKNVQPLQIGNSGDYWPAVAYIGAYYTIKAPPRGQPPSLEEHRELDPRNGQPKDLAFVLRFRSTPGAA